MTTTHHQYSDYSSSGTDYYGNYYNQSHSSQMFNSNGYYDQNANLQSAQYIRNVNDSTSNNNMSNEYQTTATNWNHLHYNQHRNQYPQTQCYSTNMPEVNNFHSYNQNNNNNSGQYQQTNNRISSSSVPFNGNPHLFSNHNYPVNRTTIHEYNDKQNLCEGYKQVCDTEKKTIKNNEFAYVNKVSPVNNNNVEYPVKSFQNQQKVEPVTSECNDEKDSPALRALLTNKNLRYTPNYPTAKRRKRAYNLSETKLTPNDGVNIDSVTLSPNKTEDGLDFLDNYTTFPTKQPQQQQQSTPMPDMSIKAGFEYIPQTQVLNKGFSPSRMTSENLPAQTSIINVHASSPMSKYVEGLSTPPLSPKETDGVNQNLTRAKSDTSSSEKQCSSWEQEGMGECKYLD